MTSALQRKLRPSSSSRPQISPPFSRIRPARPRIHSMFGSASSAARTHLPYCGLSAWARGDQTAGPRLRFSSLNCIPVASIARPINPPSASISRTRCPFAVPPTAGLHGMCATVSRVSVHRPTLHPSFAAAHAASTPACPAPITITSNSVIQLLLTMTDFGFRIEWISD